MKKLPALTYETRKLLNNYQKHAVVYKKNNQKSRPKKKLIIKDLTASKTLWLFKNGRNNFENFVHLKKSSSYLKLCVIFKRHSPFCEPFSLKRNKTFRQQYYCKKSYRKKKQKLITQDFLSGSFCTFFGLFGLTLAENVTCLRFCKWICIKLSNQTSNGEKANWSVIKL